MGLVAEVLSEMVKYGFFDIFAPFLIIFCLTYVTLESSKIFYKDKNDPIAKKIDFLVAISFGLYVIANKHIVAAIQRAIPQVSLVILVILGFFLLLAFLSGKAAIEGKLMRGIALVFAMVVVGYIFIGSLIPIEAGSATPAVVPTIPLTPTDIAFLVFIGAVAFVIYYIGKS